MKSDIIFDFANSANLHAIIYSSTYRDVDVSEDYKYHRDDTSLFIFIINFNIKLRLIVYKLLSAQVRFKTTKQD